VSITSTVAMTNKSNPALVLVHGLGSAGTIWKSLIPDLEKDFTVYSIDLPGHGEATLDNQEKYDPRSLGEMILHYMRNVHNVPKNRFTIYRNHWLWFVSSFFRDSSP
jgi:pimeloyl-ACP methyl ester carboxylesterase